MSSAVDLWMQQALDLAEHGRGYVEPNPLVGAVVVKGGKMVGEGWHEKFGQAHAEVNAIAQAGAAARGATLYVTLEPCCHHGKTPPCTDAIVRAGISKVVAAVADPFPQVAGQGAKLLEAVGIPISFGDGEAEARRQNAPYFKLLATGRPYVHAKWAMTLDGKIATRTGDAKWISNETSRRKVHELRGRMDGIVVGIGTALADDPLLTARPPGPRTPTRVVLDSQGRLPLTANLVASARETPTWVVVTPDADPNCCAVLRDKGCEVLCLPSDGYGRPLLADLLDHLGRRRWTNLLVEGGAGVLGAFLDARLVDEVHVFLSAKLVGGQSAISPIAGQGVEKIAQALSLANVSWRLMDGDMYCHGLLAGDAAGRA